jgi:transcriptional regulator with XRE-family HTH domain
MQADDIQVGHFVSHFKTPIMTIASRIRKIREVRGWKQTAIASSMNITQQAYSCLEQGASNARLETLKRFCDVMKVELPFLIATDVPITEETLGRFGQRNYNDFLTSYKKLEQKLEIFDELLKGTSSIPSHPVFGSNTNQSKPTVVRA